MKSNHMYMVSDNEDNEDEEDEEEAKGITSEDSDRLIGNISNNIVQPFSPKSCTNFVEQIITVPKTISTRKAKSKRLKKNLILPE